MQTSQQIPVLEISLPLRLWQPSATPARMQGRFLGRLGSRQLTPAARGGNWRSQDLQAWPCMFSSPLDRAAAAATLLRRRRDGLGQKDGPYRMVCHDHRQGLRR